MKEQITPISSPLVIPENTAGSNILNQNEKRPELVSLILRPSREAFTPEEWNEEPESTGNFRSFTEQIISQLLYNYFQEMLQTQTQQTITSSILLNSSSDQ